MRVVKSPAELQPGPKKVCLAIGFFDGVHLGHQQIIRQTVADAELHEAMAVVVTFDQHPNTVVAPDRVPPLIYSLPQKLRAIASTGADTTLLLHFDEAFSRQSGEQFVHWLVREFGHLTSICVGSTFTFGHKRSGNVELLKRMGAEFKFAVHGLAAVALDGDIVSSTRIREMIRNGHFDLASQMLGRGYTLCGTVMKGDGLGRKIAVPTANLDVTSLVLPPTGVYAVHAHHAGKTYRAVLNLGYRPTIQNPTPELRVEAHLLEFKGDLYGEELELTFAERLRNEQKFPSVDALKTQIAADIEHAKRVFDNG
ncbi:MAG TPA: bifunctional riboflavin kinase/FAD synthetase [Verrucomicrobiae bacterium]|nr:bifunctional riboflavin kinase/FAD synthetase [Verrucomicrobiae bacterium]